jgi:hypothetical protein
MKAEEYCDIMRQIGTACTARELSKATGSTVRACRNMLGKLIKKRQVGRKLMMHDHCQIGYYLKEE